MFSLIDIKDLHFVAKATALQHATKNLNVILDGAQRGLQQKNALSTFAVATTAFVVSAKVVKYEYAMAE